MFQFPRCEQRSKKGHGGRVARRRRIGSRRAKEKKKKRGGATSAREGPPAARGRGQLGVPPAAPRGAEGPSPCPRGAALPGRNFRRKSRGNCYERNDSRRGVVRPPRLLFYTCLIEASGQPSSERPSRRPVAVRSRIAPSRPGTREPPPVRSFGVPPRARVHCTRAFSGSCPRAPPPTCPSPPVRTTDAGALRECPGAPQTGVTPRLLA